MKNLHDKRFPGENEKYRETRNQLLEAEIQLRRKTEEVAALRRKLPMGGKIKEDYVFEELDSEGRIKQTKLSQLFESGKDTLIIYSFMYGPEQEKACPACTSIMDGLDGMIFHANERINFVLVTKSPIDKMKRWADSRGWKNLRMLSSNKNSYNNDYFAEDTKGNQLPALNVFQKTPEGLFHFYNTEALYTPPDENQNPRHVDMIWPLWSLFDLTPGGRGGEWFPDYSYESNKTN